MYVLFHYIRSMRVLTNLDSVIVKRGRIIDRGLSDLTEKLTECYISSLLGKTHRDLGSEPLLIE